MSEHIIVPVVLLNDLVDPDPCHFDHHGGCQAHGYLSHHCQWIAPHQAAAAIAAIMMSTTRWKLNQWDGFVGFPDDAAHIVEVRYGERLNWDAIDWDEPIATPKE